MKERKRMTKKAQVLWTLGKREHSINIDSGIISDIVIISKRKTYDS
jgi:hypothetical protein